jgi:hypothetical protein
VTARAKARTCLKIVGFIVEPAYAWLRQPARASAGMVEACCITTAEGHLTSAPDVFATRSLMNVSVVQ